MSPTLGTPSVANSNVVTLGLPKIDVVLEHRQHIRCGVQLDRVLGVQFRWVRWVSRVLRVITVQISWLVPSLVLYSTQLGCDGKPSKLECEEKSDLSATHRSPCQVGIASSGCRQTSRYPSYSPKYAGPTAGTRLTSQLPSSSCNLGMRSVSPSCVENTERKLEAKGVKR